MLTQNHSCCMVAVLQDKGHRNKKVVFRVLSSDHFTEKKDSREKSSVLTLSRPAAEAYRG